jgi:hypothetical protein
MAKYNGWRNWQTWNVALWFGNDEGLYRHAIDARNGMPRRKFNAESVQAFVLEMLPNGTPDMDGQVELAGVDWRSIASAFNEF